MSGTLRKSYVTNAGDTVSQTVKSLQILEFAFCGACFREKEVILSALGLRTTQV